MCCPVTRSARPPGSRNWWRLMIFPSSGRGSPMMRPSTAVTCAAFRRRSPTLVAQPATWLPQWLPRREPKKQTGRLTCSFSVELVRRYSNRADLQERLAEARSRASQLSQQEPGAHSVALSARVSRTWRVRDRLTDADVECLIAEFLAGTPKRVLAERYAVSFSTVKNILRKHGVRRPD